MSAHHENKLDDYLPNLNMKLTYERETRKPKVALIYGPLLHYRIPLFQALAERYELTVFATAFDQPSTKLNFATEVLPSLKIGRFTLQKGLRRRLIDGKFDICISFLDVSHLDSLAAALLPVAPTTISWGVWLTGNAVADCVRLFAVRRSHSAIFYCYQHSLEVAAHGIEPQKLYVAPNTVSVDVGVELASPTDRDSFLFVGSFTARKGLDRLVKLFARALGELPERVKLVLVGDGPEGPKLRALVDVLGISDRVVMPGRSNDFTELASYYKRAFAAISLNQAGLSVLQSMGFGIPFMTVEGSISGGETLNIVDGVNGRIVADSDEAIVCALIAFVEDYSATVSMGMAAKEHYLSFATIENYAQGFFDAVEGTRLARVWQADRQAKL